MEDPIEEKEVQQYIRCRERSAYKAGCEQAMKEVKEQWRCERCKYFDKYYDDISGEVIGMCERPTGKNNMLIWSLPFGCTYFEPKDKE